MVSTCLLLTVIESAIMNTIVDVIMPGDRESGFITQNGRSLPEDFTKRIISDKLISRLIKKHIYQKLIVEI